MAVLTTLQLEHVTMLLGRDQVPRLSEAGEPVMDTSGPLPQPLLVDRTLLIFACEETRTRVIVPLDDDGRRALVGMLTGGIVVPANGSHPGGG